MDEQYDFEERLLSDARGYLAERPDLYERLRDKALSSKGKLQWRILDELLAKELLPRLLRTRRLQDSDAYNAVMDNLPLLDEMVTIMKRSPNPRTRVEAFPLVADMLVRNGWKGIANPPTAEAQRDLDLKDYVSKDALEKWMDDKINEYCSEDLVELEIDLEKFLNHGKEDPKMDKET